MAVTINGSGPITGLTTIASPTTINGVTLPTTGFGKILQIVRATDETRRTTTSLSFVDGSISVTITPQKDTSNIILIHQCVSSQGVSGTRYASVQITDSSNTALSGAQDNIFGINTTTSVYHVLTQIGYASPATTSAVTYKVRFKSDSGTTVGLENASSTGQLFAIEVSA
jgi:hypothetical protein